MGDSITDFWPQPRFGAFFPGKNYVGRGISAQTTPQMLIRMRPDVIALKAEGGGDPGGNQRHRGQHRPDDRRANRGEPRLDGRAGLGQRIKVVLSSITPVSNYHVANPNAAPQTTPGRSPGCAR
jgi:hypothetical protein